jgi:hypothetical protein
MRAAALLLLCAACSTSGSDPQLESDPLIPLMVQVTTDPPPAGDGTILRDARLIVQLDDYPDPDAVAMFGPVLLRSGSLNFDFDLRVDLVGKAVIITPRSLLQPGTHYQLTVDASLRALDGRTLGQSIAVDLPAGQDLGGPPAPRPKVIWSNLNLPIFNGLDLPSQCSGCHNRINYALPDRSLDMGGDPRDPVYGLIRVASVGLSDTAKPLERVTPFDSSRSVLMRKLLGGSHQEASTDPPYPQMGVDGRRMPKDGPYLSDGDLRTVQDWIDQGALLQ